MKLLVKGIFIVICGVLSVGSFSNPVDAEDVSVKAAVSSKTVELGSALTLTVTIDGAQEVPPVQLPKIEGVETRYLGPNIRVSTINGAKFHSMGVRFSVIPLKTGQFQIPALTISLDGKDYTTTPIDITVMAATAGPPGQTGAKDKDAASSLQDKIFIVLGTSKKETYVSEPIPVVIKLFINDLAVKNVQYPSLEHDGFAVEDFPEPRRGRQTLGDVNYQVMEFRTFIYPTRTGDLNLGPAHLGANIMIKNSRREDMPGEFNDIFTDDLFDNFLGRYETKTIMLESANIGLKVLPLPPEGRPQDFSGGVGKYNFDITVSPAEVKVGDPLTVRMKIAGDGNLQAVNFPLFKTSPDFKVYDPKITSQNGEKVLEQVIIPNHDQVKELPAVSFSFFDPADKQYHTITKGPFPLLVSPLAKGEESKVVGLTAPAMGAKPVAGPEELGRDIRFIKESIGRVQRQGNILYRQPGFILSVILLVMVWLGLFVNFEYRKRIMTDVRWARRLQAPRQAQEGLAQAGNFLRQNDVRNFYDRIYKTLQDYFGNNFHLSSADVTLGGIETRLKPQHKNNAALASLREIFAECELVRFACAQVSEEKMKNIFQKTQEVIDFFERNYK